MLRSFYSFEKQKTHLNTNLDTDERESKSRNEEDFMDASGLQFRAVFDLNWSSDGTLLAAGLEKNVVILDMRKILSCSIESLQN